MLMRRFLLLVFLSALAAPAAAAQEIRILHLSGFLYSLDVKTAEMQYLGATGLHTYLWSAMAVDGQGRMFGAYGRDDFPYAIYELNPDTAQATFVAQTNLIGITSMAFGPGGVLYVTNERDAPLIASPTDLHTVDLLTGATTLIGEVVGAGRVHGTDFYGGELYGFGTELGLVKLDTQTAQVIDVNPAFAGPPLSTVSMCFSNSGALYFVDASLWMIDPQSGVLSLVNLTSSPSFWAEAEFFEGPADPFALWVGGVTNGPMSVRLSGATPNANVAVAWSKGTGAAGPTAIPAGFPCAGTLIDLKGNMQLLSVLHTNADGEAHTMPQFVPAGAKRAVRLQAVDLSSCKTSNRILIAF